MNFLQPESQHSKHQTGYITQVMPGIGKQSQRIIIKPYSEFYDNKSNIQSDAYDKSLIERCQLMIMFVMMRFHIIYCYYIYYLKNILLGDWFIPIPLSAIVTAPLQKKQATEMNESSRWLIPFKHL